MEEKNVQELHDREAARLIGWALFNLTKGNTEAAITLMKKAFRALTGQFWDEWDNPE